MYSIYITTDMNRVGLHHISSDGVIAIRMQVYYRPICDNEHSDGLAKSSTKLIVSIKKQRRSRLVLNDLID